MTTLFTILFDGIAYGMLLFVLACGLSVTLGLMNFVNLAHGAFAMAGGYVTRRAGEPLRRAVPRRRCRSPSSSSAADRRRCWSARSTGMLYNKPPPRPGAVLHRPRLHVGGGGRLRHGLAAAVHQAAGLAARAQSTSSASASAATGCSSSSICGLLTVALQLHPGATRASAAGCAPRWTTRASRAGSASTCNAVFALTFAFGSRPRRPRRRAGRRDPRARPELPAEVHDLLPDRGGGRRHLQHHRAVPGLAAARHRRRRRQVLRAQARRLRHLHHDDRRS